MRLHILIAVIATLGVSNAAEKPANKPVELALEDQYERKQSLADYRGKVVILVFGDRKGTDASRELGEKLHVLFHPTAAGQPPEKARKAPVAALQGVPAGVPSPDVVVVPVAVAGKVPDVVKGLIRTALKKDVADTPVWLDFGSAMADQFGLKDGEPNMVVLDGTGRLRMKLNGMPDKASFEKVLQTAQNLRAEAAGLR